MNNNYHGAGAIGINPAEVVLMRQHGGTEQMILSLHNPEDNNNLMINNSSIDDSNIRLSMSLQKSKQQLENTNIAGGSSSVGVSPMKNNLSKDFGSHTNAYLNEGMKFKHVKPKNYT